MASGVPSTGRRARAPCLDGARPARQEPETGPADVGQARQMPQLQAMDDLQLSHYRDRRDAGRQLAEALAHYREADPVVLALPRGGVPVGREIARALHAPLDVLLVRKLGAPGFPELGLGAVVEGEPPQRVLNERVMEAVQPSEAYLADETARQIEEIGRRRTQYRGERPLMPLTGRTVILTDDGVATGGTVRVALQALAQAGVRHLVLALPVAPRELLASLAAACDDFVCPHAPPHFASVGACYDDFTQVEDGTVIALLQDAAAAQAAAPEGAAFEPEPPDPEELDIEGDPGIVTPLGSLPARGPLPVPALLKPWPLSEPGTPAAPTPAP